MKGFLFLVLLVVAPVPAHAQLDVSKILMGAGEKALAGLTPLSAGERKEILEVLVPSLESRFTFRDDGTVSSSHHLHEGVTHIEWTSLKIQRIMKDSLMDSDRLNGLTRRYRISFTCKSHRTWDRATNRWSAWRPTGYVLFPAFIIEEQGGKLAVRVSEYGQFLPGPARSLGPAALPASEAPPNALPPGMQRTRK